MAIRRICIALAALAGLVTLSGCFWNQQVETSQVGLLLPDGVTVQSVVAEGRYTNMGWYAELAVIDVSAKTLEWEDPDLVTHDKQPIGLRLAVTYSRRRDRESILLMWDTYRGEASSDELLQRQVETRIPGVAKTVTVRYTLDEMLGVEGAVVEGVGAAEPGRERVTEDMFTMLSPQLEECGIQLLDIRISNIAPDPQYLEKLQEKARANVEREVAMQRTAQLQEQLKQEKAQTEIALEIARRENQVNEELARVYEKSSQYFELERLTRLSEVIGSSDKIYFVPQGTDLTLILGGEAEQNVVPVPTGE
jgi:regulator of protease activity HflC (stomatin/prohibitin superfamily)